MFLNNSLVMLFFLEVATERSHFIWGDFSTARHALKFRVLDSQKMEVRAVI